MKKAKLKIIKYLNNNKGGIDDALISPYILLLILVTCITLMTLLLQLQQYNSYCDVLDQLTDVYIRKPMEEEGGFKSYMKDDFENALRQKSIDVNKVKIVDATRYPVDRGEPLEVLVQSEYEIKALAYIGGPILKRPVTIKKIGVSQKFFR